MKSNFISDRSPKKSGVVKSGEPSKSACAYNIIMLFM